MLVDNQFPDAKTKVHKTKSTANIHSGVLQQLFLVSITSCTAQCNQSCHHTIGTASPFMLYTIGKDARINHSKTPLAVCSQDKKSCNNRNSNYITVRHYPCAYTHTTHALAHTRSYRVHPTQDYMCSGSSRQCTVSYCGNVLHNTHVPFHDENEPVCISG